MLLELDFSVQWNHCRHKIIGQALNLENYLFQCDSYKTALATNVQRQLTVLLDGHTHCCRPLEQTKLEKLCLVRPPRHLPSYLLSLIIKPYRLIEPNNSID